MTGAVHGEAVANPLASVAMVTYNSGSFVAEAMASVLAQSYRNLELVICDDCSTDDTWEVINRCQDPRVRAFRNEKNLGEYANRNQAARLARGEYLIYIDGDDFLYPHGLEFLVRMLHAFPQSGMALALPWSEKFLYPVELTPREYFLCAYLGPAVTAINFAHLLFRRSALLEVGGLDTRYRCGDTHVQYAIARKHNCLLVSDGVAWWRRTPGQASERILRDHVNVLEALEYKTELLGQPDCPLTPSEIEIALGNIYGGFIRTAIYCALKGRPRHALDLLRKGRLPAAAWRHTWRRSRYHYLSGVTAACPIKTELARNPFAAF